METEKPLKKIPNLYQIHQSLLQTEITFYIEFSLNKHNFDDSDQKTEKNFEKKIWPKFQLFG